MKKIVEWIEPGPYGSCIVRELTVEEAIGKQRTAAASVRPGFVYESDEQALDDFVTVHWAWIKEIDEEIGE